ncbi:helix-turn-helix domain-containing protein [Nocardia miyunensis]|uniref:AraC family transcriptional regulator n=1 Tax=Nocardia miyunensis TaxID=282684 RepID=UPI000836CD03
MGSAFEPDGAGVSEGARAAPDPRLRPYLGDYAGYRLRGFPPGVHIGMPSTALTVIVTIDEPIELPVSCHPAQPGGRWDALASGLTVRPCLIGHHGYQHGVQLALTPLGARVLFGVPTADLGSWLVDLTDLLGPRAAELRERMAATADWSRRFAILDQVLLDLMREATIEPELRRAWQLLTGSAGRARVAAVAEEIGWSRRHLGSRFAAEFGITPKDAARLARFESSHRLLRTVATEATEPGTGASLAEVAAATGYYDQAHMAREWRELAGLPPSRWLECEVFPFVQGPVPELLEG